MKRIIKLLIFLPMIFISCAKLEKDFPIRNFYIIDVNRQTKNTAIKSDKTLEINTLNISPSFSGREFVYRISDNKYISDFYSQFFKPPVKLVYIETYEWLTKSGIFKNVISRPIPVEPDYLLDANVSELYIDLRKSDRSNAVLSIQFFITEELPSESKLIFTNNYSEQVPLDSRSPDNFIKGWNKALENILTELEKDLSGLEL